MPRRYSVTLGLLSGASVTVASGVAFGAGVARRASTYVSLSDCTLLSSPCQPTNARWRARIAEPSSPLIADGSVNASATKSRPKNFTFIRRGCAQYMKIPGGRAHGSRCARGDEVLGEQFDPVARSDFVAR